MFCILIVRYLGLYRFHKIFIEICNNVFSEIFIETKLHENVHLYIQVNIYIMTY